VVVCARTTIATTAVRPVVFQNLLSRPGTWPLAACVFAGIIAVFVLQKQRRELPAFLASAFFLLSMLGATAAGLYPHLLFSTLDPGWSLDIHNSVAGGIGLSIGLVWWTFALALAVVYFVYLFRSFQGKTVVEEDGHGY
jgi:cytochrome d ubiquinol oxidase subunit II